ncbi:MAG: alanine--tRNA ligase [Bacteroidetes bacterium]|jgi:alanyl-tRNA synthetase|nr:alanine--tRNA ligase [Bacteroidota bacterium]
MPSTDAHTLTSEVVRQQFLDFFQEKGHEIVDSASLVPQNDPTLLFTNAGMNQFKDVFLGEGSRPYSRAADTQKCLRVSGKHNDLEEVGYDTYHHTFFEMLGNWSFGDYFKQEAIAWAWELLVTQWGLAPDRLYATVHEGDDGLGLTPDEEAAGFWRSETDINPDHILFCPSKDNFWMMGDTGPCGPCSEVHIDLRPEAEREETPGRDLVNADHPAVIEIWNLVFIQYNAQSDGALEPLADQHVDTGMGFERIVAVLQDKISTYDTDLFAPLLARICELAPRAEVRGYDDLAIAEAKERERVRIALRVVADHIRTCSFAIADGVMPGNSGRGYVIRRILRRAVRYGYQTLGFRAPFLHKLVGVLLVKMGQSFPELIERESYITRVIRSEEESFLETLGTGIDFFEQIVPHAKQIATQDASAAPQEALRKDRAAMDLLEKAFVDTDDHEAMVARFAAHAAQGQIPGAVAFLLHDTYGFPVDLTELMAREEGLSLDRQGYDAHMQEQKERARAASDFSPAAPNGAAPAADSAEATATEFVGYDRLRVDDAVVVDARTVQHNGTTMHQVVLDKTPFYAESGGQVGDQGVLEVGEQTLEVLDTQWHGAQIVHRVNAAPEPTDAPVRATVDAARRRRIQKHHTATHLLHAILREELGTHVEQQGSLVAPDRLRFDFSHYEGVSDEALRTIEARVNEAIQRNIPKDEARDVPYAEAIDRGAIALFGEKYGDTVRVITFGPDFSMELCGGTHVEATGEIGLFRLTSEGSVAAGVRRVEAVAGPAALHYTRGQVQELEQARAQFKSLQRPLDEAVAALLDERKSLQQTVEELQHEKLAQQLDAFMQQRATIDDITLVTGQVASTDMDALRALGQELRGRLPAEAVGVLGTVDPEGEKVYLVCAVTDDLKERLPAGTLVGRLAKRVGGGGGGRPGLATAGGRQPEQLSAALQATAEVIRDVLA